MRCKSLLCLFVTIFQAWEAVRLEFLSGRSSSATYREKLIQYFSQQLRCFRLAVHPSLNKCLILMSAQDNSCHYLWACVCVARTVWHGGLQMSFPGCSSSKRTGLNCSSASWTCLSHKTFTRGTKHLIRLTTKAVISFQPLFYWCMLFFFWFPLQGPFLWASGLLAICGQRQKLNGHWVLWLPETLWEELWERRQHDQVGKPLWDFGTFPQGPGPSKSGRVCGYIFLTVE